MPNSTAPPVITLAKSYLDDLELLKSLLYQILYLSGILDMLILPICVSRPALRVFSEVVGLKLLALSQ